METPPQLGCRVNPAKTNMIRGGITEQERINKPVDASCGCYKYGAANAYATGGRFRDSSFLTFTKAAQSAWQRSRTLPTPGQSQEYSFNNLVMANAGCTVCQGDRYAPDMQDVYTLNGYITAGIYNTSLFTKNPHVYALGRNYFGELGRVTSNFPPDGEQNQGYQFLSNNATVSGDEYAVASVSAWDYTTLIQNTGRLVGYGIGDNAQMGRGTTTLSNAPGYFTLSGGQPLSNVVSVDCVTVNTIAVTASGDVYGCGRNYAFVDQLGYYGAGDPRTITDAAVYMQQLSLDISTNPAAGKIGAVAKVITGDITNYYLTKTGRLYGRGGNYSGELGIGTMSITNAGVLTEVSYNILDGMIPGQIKDVAAGQGWVMVLTNDGNVFGCGENGSGQLGGTPGPVSPSWVKFGFTEPIAKIYTRNSVYGLAIGTSGTVYTWGDFTFGRNGQNNTTEIQVVPEMQGAIDATVAIQTGFLYYPDGRVKSFGINDYFTLLRNMSLASPQRVPSLAADLSWAIYPGNYFVFAARRNTSLPIYGSGYGSEGAFGINTSVIYDSPQVINFAGNLASKTMNDIKDITCGQGAIIILNDVSGSTYTMGNNNFGQIGDGTFANSLAPFKLDDLSGYTAEKSTSGVTHSLILCRNRSTPANVLVRFIGSSIYGEAGLGTTGYVYVTPTLMDISTLKPSLMSAGLFFTVLYDASANIMRTCGRNNRGQLGDTTTTNRTVLTDVSWGSTKPSRLTKIVSGYYHSLALDSSGNVWSWGYNNAGQLGRFSDNRVINRIENISGGTVFTDIAAGSSTSFAVTSSGELYAWGNNETALIGDRSLRFFNPVPVKIPSIPTVKNVYAAAESAYITTTTGEIYSFGRNHFGEAMRETPEYKPTYINPEPGSAPQSIPLLKTQVPIIV
jgi:alpha-tubulin suppressor-like RCC1 family protein